MKENNIASRNTIQRNLVYAAMKRLMHPTAEEVYNEVVTLYPDISKATVYRNLKVLTEKGDIIKISSPEGADHYDTTLHKHYHAVCKECGRAFDVDVTSSFEKELDSCIKNSYGFEIEVKDVVFSGLCPICKSNKN